MSNPWEITDHPQTGKVFSGILYRGEGVLPKEAARDRVPSQFAVGQHWSTQREVAETYGPIVRQEKVELKIKLKVLRRKIIPTPLQAQLHFMEILDKAGEKGNVRRLP